MLPSRRTNASTKSRQHTRVKRRFRDYYLYRETSAAGPVGGLVVRGDRGHVSAAVRPRGSEKLMPTNSSPWRRGSSGKQLDDALNAAAGHFRVHVFHLGETRRYVAHSCSVAPCVARNLTDMRVRPRGWALPDALILQDGALGEVRVRRELDVDGSVTVRAMAFSSVAAVAALQNAWFLCVAR